MVSASSDTDKLSGRGERVQRRLHRRQRRGVAATCCHASACATTSGLWAYSASSADHRANDVPPAGNAIGCPPRCWAQAMFKSSNRIRHDTPSTARW